MVNDDTYLGDIADPLLPDLPAEVTYDAYGAQLQLAEKVLNRLFAEVESADSAGEYALSLANTKLDSASKSTQDLQSQVAAGRLQADRLSAQSLPITGGQYTHLVTDSFQNNGVRDAVSDFESQPLVLRQPDTSHFSGCPPRPALEMDAARQVLRMKREGVAVVFDGVPADDQNILGGETIIDRVFGTPVEPRIAQITDPWQFSVASRSPLVRGFALGDLARPDWVPSTYDSGAVVRMRVKLTNPSPLTEVRLRGGLNANTVPPLLLETIAAVDSRPLPHDPTSVPGRAVSTAGNFPALTNWSDQITTVPATTLHNTGPGGGAAALVHGLISQKLTNLRPGDHYVLRYDAAAYYTDDRRPTGVTPVCPESTWVQVYYYADTDATLGVDSPLGCESFRDDYAHQGGLFAGWSHLSHLLTVPEGAACAHFLVGVDPYVTNGLIPGQSGACIAYANVWITDEAVTRLWSRRLPAPAATNLPGPNGGGTGKSYVAEDTIDSLRIPVGNDTGSLVFSDVWITLGQSSPDLEDAADWQTHDAAPAPEKPSLPAYRLSLPADTPHGRAARDPLLLHQARYVGEGVHEQDASAIRLGGEKPVTKLRVRRPNLRGANGLPTALQNREGRRSPLPDSADPQTGSFWRETPSAPNRRTPISQRALAIGSRWSTLWGQLIGIAKSSNRPTSLFSSVLEKLSIPDAPAPETGTLYVYTLALSSLALLRQEYAPSGTYVTRRLKDLDNAPGNAIAGEIREISLLTDPGIATLGPRLRTWIIPDSSAQSDDSALALLDRAIPLDSQNPRATFHASTEIRPGVQPAFSDVAQAFGLPNPAFYINPSFHSQLIDGGLDPDSAVSGVQLDYMPYVNTEAIRNIVQTIAAGNKSNPNVYDPNAIRPVIDFLQTFDSGFISTTNAAFGFDNKPHITPSSVNTVSLPFRNNSNVVVKPVEPYTTTITLVSGVEGVMFDPDAVIIPKSDGTLAMNFVAPAREGDYQVDVVLTIAETILLPAQTYTVHVIFNVKQAKVTSDTLAYVSGYRPVSIRLQLPSGRTILPDSLGKPRPGEIIYEPFEVLTPATDIDTQTSPAQTAPYLYSTSDTPSNANKLTQISRRSYVTAHTPIACGPTGMAIDLYWHQSQDFEAASGGANSRFDVKIPPSEYVVDAHTGQITVYSQPPYGWSAYDQIVARYFWRVGDIAPREWFPPPNILALQVFDELLNPLNFQTNTPSLPATSPKVIVGYTTGLSGELLKDNYIKTPGGVPDGNNLSLQYVWKCDVDGAGHRVGDLSQMNDATPNNPFGGNPFILDNLEGVHQDVPYPGAGEYMPVLGVALWTADGGDRQHASEIRSLEVTLTVWDTDPDTPVESSDTFLVTPIAWTNVPANYRSFVTPNYPLGYPKAGTFQTYYLSKDLGTEGAGTDPIVFNTTEHTGKKLRIHIQTGPGNHGGTGIQLGYASMTGIYTQAVYGYPDGYDENGNLIPTPVFTSVTTDVSGGLDAGTVSDVPIVNVASLLKGPIQQSYPVTRNVTNYASSTPAELRPPNFDYQSPDYYPIIEYRIEPGQKLRFATDFSNVGVFAGTKILIEHEFLDINPRIILEVLPPGHDQFTSPYEPTTANDLRPQVTTPEISALHCLINARY